jgi:hypothetical protein
VTKLSDEVRRIRESIHDAQDLEEAEQEAATPRQVYVRARESMRATAEKIHNNPVATSIALVTAIGSLITSIGASVIVPIVTHDNDTEKRVNLAKAEVELIAKASIKQIEEKALDCQLEKSEQTKLVESWQGKHDELQKKIKELEETVYGRKLGRNQLR